MLLFVSLVIFCFQCVCFPFLLSKKLMNIEKAWQRGFTGNNVIIGTVDSGGVDWTNREFHGKFVSFIVFFKCFHLSVIYSCSL